MKEAIEREICFAMPFAIALYRCESYIFMMFLEVAVSEEERKRIMSYAQSEKIRMDRAYAELIRAGLQAKGVV